MKHFLAFLFFAAQLWATDWRISAAVDFGQGFRPFWCRTNCHAGADILFDDVTGTNGCTQVYTMAQDGTGKVNLTTTLFTGGTTLNQGGASWSPDGQWIILSMQSNLSPLPCVGNNTDGGGGWDNDIFVCKYATGVCTNLTNSPIDDAHGYLRGRFTMDGLHIFIMHYDQRLPSGTRIGGLITCDWNPAIPTVQNCIQGNPAGFRFLFEPADSDPTAAATCVLYTQVIGATIPDSRVWKWDFCALTPAVPLTDLTSYAEFWNVTPNGNIALYTSSQFTPTPRVTGFNQGFDLVQADAKSGLNRIPLTCFNTPGSSDWRGPGSLTTVGIATWKGDGTQFLAAISFNGAPTHLWRYNYTQTTVAP